MKNLYLLGSTGSIGKQTLEVVRSYPGEFNVITLCANRSIETIGKQIEEFSPAFVSVGSKEAAMALKTKYPDCMFGVGEEGIERAATLNPDDKQALLVNALVGSVGLAPTAKAIAIGRDVALANKETLVVGGFLIRRLIKEHGVSLLPVDSEHSAIWQALRGEKNNPVRQIIITSSGGAFRDKTRDELKHVTKEEALRHPNWSMGDKITIDSATMMNKGFEVIEALHLFGVGMDHVKTVLHRESIIHGMVEFDDGSVMTHMAKPDMRLPIAYALFYPKRRPTGVEPLDIDHLRLSFAPLDESRYPLLRVAKEAYRKGTSAPCVLNAANEAAVALFLDDKISFLDIETAVTHYVREHQPLKNPSVGDLLKLDHQIKEHVYAEYS